MFRGFSLLGVVSAYLLVLSGGCGGSVSGGGSGGSTSQSSSSSSGASGGSGGSGGVMTGGGGSSAGGGMMTGGGGSAGSGGVMTGGGGSGGSNYATCADCTGDTGAITNECKAARDACFSMKECVSLYNCNYFGIAGGPGPCDSTQDGACCSLQCDKKALTPESVLLYRALDQCIYCKTCTALCDTANTYCPVFQPGGDAVCPP